MRCTDRTRPLGFVLFSSSKVSILPLYSELPHRLSKLFPSIVLHSASVFQTDHNFLSLMSVLYSDESRSPRLLFHGVLQWFCLFEVGFLFFIKSSYVIESLEIPAASSVLFVYVQALLPDYRFSTNTMKGMNKYLKWSLDKPS